MKIKRREEKEGEKERNMGIIKNFRKFIYRD
jgi:hypothetical protein